MVTDMPTFFVEQTGTPIIDPHGCLMPITGVTELKQRINNVFNTQRGSESLFVDYGFDLISFISSSQYLNPIQALRIAAIDALTPSKIFDMESLDKLECYITGTTGFIDISCTFSEIGKFNNSILLEGGTAQ
jgi:hypothetical protein